MKRDQIVTAVADEDMRQAARWYDGKRKGLGKEFLAEMLSILAEASRTPSRFSRLRKKAPQVRRATPRRFPYIAVFAVYDDHILVFRVLHAARHDRNWRRFAPR